MQKASKALYFLIISYWHKMAQVKRKVMYMYAHTHAKKLAAMANDLCQPVPVVPALCSNHCDFHNLGVASAS